MQAVALAQVATAIAFWGGALLLASLRSPLQSFIMLGTAVTTTVGLALWWAVRDRMHSATGSLFDVSLIKTNAGSSSWFFLGQMCSIGVFQLDRAAVSMLVGPAAAGAYSVAASVSNKLLASSSSMLTFLMPYAAASGIDDREELGRLVCQSERLLALLLLPTVIPVWLGADAITHLWLGATAAPEVAAALKYLWPAFTIPAITAPTGNAFLALGSPAVAAAFSVLTLASFLTLLWLLGVEHGILGAGVAFLVSMSFSILFHAVARHKLRLVADKDRLAFQGSLALGLAIQGVAALAFALSTLANGHMPALICAAVIWLSFYLGRALAGSTTTMERNLLRRILSYGARRGQ
jgi:O-antigen/teichoic acid export membrane protein